MGTLPKPKTKKFRSIKEEKRARRGRESKASVARSQSSIESDSVAEGKFVTKPEAYGRFKSAIRSQMRNILAHSAKSKSPPASVKAKMTQKV